MAAEQTYKSHRKYIPIFHFFVEPVLLLNVIAQVLYFNKYRTSYKAWMIVVAIALAIVPFAARFMMARVQDRVIRLEERLTTATPGFFDKISFAASTREYSSPM